MRSIDNSNNVGGGSIPPAPCAHSDSDSFSDAGSCSVVSNGGGVYQSSSGAVEDAPDNRGYIMEQMEMNFFHNQPDSTKKAVEFFSERIASNLIKVSPYFLSRRQHSPDSISFFCSIYLNLAFK